MRRRAVLLGEAAGNDGGYVTLPVINAPPISRNRRLPPVDLFQPTERELS